jgi:hypothetical protein
MSDTAFNDIPQADVFKDQSPSQNDGHVDPEMPNPQPGFRIEALSGWRKAKSLVKLKQQVDAKFAGRSTESDGFIGDERHCHGRRSIKFRSLSLGARRDTGRRNRFRHYERSQVLRLEQTCSRFDRQQGSSDQVCNFVPTDREFVCGWLT